MGEATGRLSAVGWESSMSTGRYSNGSGKPHSRPGRVFVTALFLAALAAMMTMAEQGPHRGARPLPSGVVALDVYARGPTVELLQVVRADGAQLLQHQRSRDAGASWSPAVTIDVADNPIGVATRGSGPQVVSHGDHVVVHWSTAGVHRHGGPMASAVSHDGGRTWTTGPNPAEDGTDHAQNFSDMVADPAGTFYVSWIARAVSCERRNISAIIRATGSGEARCSVDEQTMEGD